MYAVIESGGKQYRVSPGDVLDVERVALGEGEDQGKVRFDRVLAVSGDNGLEAGLPAIGGAGVRASRVGARAQDPGVQEEEAPAVPPDHRPSPGPPPGADRGDPAPLVPAFLNAVSGHRS